MDLLTFLLADHRCPHCRHSLRWRLVRSAHVCPVCGGGIEIEHHHAAGADDWPWAKRLLPGLLVWVVAMLNDFQPLLMVAGTAMLVIGFVFIVRYALLERLGWRCYSPWEPPDENT